jgi:metallophosphoesterase superfamily enzyme
MAFPGRKRAALIEVPSDWREEDAAEMGRLLGESFAELILVAADGHPTIENLMRKIDHYALRRESTWLSALDRIIGEAGPSDCIFVGPSKRASRDQANENCKKRNMARLD